MDCIIFALDTKIGNISLREGRFFVAILDENQIVPFYSKSIKATSKYLCDIFENSNTEIKMTYNYNKNKTSSKKELKIQDLLKKEAEINVRYISSWLLFLLK